VEKEYEGKMLHCDGVTTEFCVTPTHRLYSSRQYNYRKAKNYKFELGTIDTFGIEFPIKKDAIWKGKEQLIFYLPDIEGNASCKRFFEINMNDWLEFLGVYLAEGFSSKSHYQVLITQFPNSNYFESIKRILDRLPFNFKYDERQKRFYCMSKQLYEYVLKLGNSRTKYIPREFLQLSTDHLNHLLFGMMIGDGTIDPYGNYVKYDSVSNQLINDVQELLLKTNRYGNVHVYFYPEMISPTNGKLYTDCSPCWRIWFSTRKGYTTVNRKRNIKEIDYKGKIYCVEVPNHIIYVRQNGKGMWSGNSLRYVTMSNLVYRPPEFTVKPRIPEVPSPTGYF
jgi:replicative DNA helicase Mcm